MIKENEKDTETSAFDNKNGTGDMLDNIEKSGSITAGSNGVNIHCLTIIGQIEGHYVLDNTQKATKYEHIIPLLTAIEEGTQIDGLLIVLNTQGGDVEAGLALAELIASMKKPTVSLVLGGGHSIGVPLAVSAKRSFVVPSATMTIHPVRTTGLVVGVHQSFAYFARMQDRICSFISAHSRISKEKLSEYMLRTDQIATDVGSIIDGKEAVNCGLIDGIGGLDAALAALHEMIGEK
ncbi:MAG: ATP-dependent Clp protease proteolytic subunit [Clostridia bacterium]|nr:ATP-dependent Clp protease proteolytic subunit [Clostridia bacterium]